MPGPRAGAQHKRRRPMALKKSQLYSSLWSSCDELRGGMDASQYKDYVLTLLFMKYVSDKYAGKDDALIEVPPGGSFADMVKLKGNKDIGEKINVIIGALAKANGLVGVIDQADFDDDDRLGKGQEKQDRLSKLVAIFEGLDFRANRAGGDDLLGDAYEYLMRNFATESGKSKGQFYTPAEVSRVMAKVVGVGPQTRPDQTIYDPTCGSGSLLLKAADEAPSGITIYGQENDNATYALARMNMILHGQPTADLRRGNTLAAPELKNPDGALKTFDFAVANPPFSSKAWSNGLDPSNDEFHRFSLGVPPTKNGDYAFLLHVVASLKSTGKAAVILPHGVLFRSNKEADIRRNLITRGLIKGVIGLPPNLFYGTGIPACILVIDKENAQAHTGIFMVDASKGFMKDGAKNRLRAQDIHRIVDVFTRQVEVPRYSRMVPVAEIASPANDYNLNIPRYVDASEPEDLQDLDAHLRGGIPQRDVSALEPYWAVFPSLRSELFEAGDRPGYSRARVATGALGATILDHKEFQTFADRVGQAFVGWRSAHEARLKAVAVGDRPKTLIQMLAEDLLARFAALPLLSRYDVYQRLMDYWDETMQDDVYLLSSDGWLEAARPRLLAGNTDQKVRETPDLVVGGAKNAKKYKMDLVPPGLLVARYFPTEQAALVELEVARDEADRALEEFVDEYSGEGGALEDLVTESGTLAKGAVAKRQKDLMFDPESVDELAVLTQCLALIDAATKASAAAKGAKARLDTAVLARYSTLTEAEVQASLVEDKWLCALRDAVDDEVRRVTVGLVERVRELEERYAETLPALEWRVSSASDKVMARLALMGLVV